MTRLASTPPPSPEPPNGKPFRYGWRYVTRKRPDGSEEHVEVPLTLEDVLHPQEGDVIPENTQQERDHRYLHDVLERHYANDPHVLTLSDCLVAWGVRGLRSHSPDITVIEGVPTKEGQWGTYRIARDGGRPLLVIEIVSPDTRSNDVDIKPRHYYRAGIPLYVIVDQEREEGPRSLIGYERRANGYVELPPGADGRLTLAPVGIRLGLRDGRVVCWDAESDEELGDYVGVCHRLEQEIAAREKAERQAKQAEKRQKAEAKARRAAQREAKEARDRVRELEEQLRRLRGNGAAP
jgi:Uma2 family endonuclease